MTEKPHAGDIALSEDLRVKGIFGAGVSALREIATLTEEKGARVVSLAAGTLILIALVVEFVARRDYIPHDAEIVALAIAGIIVISGIVASSLEYRWLLNAKVREQELITKQLELETNFHIARLQETRITTHARESSIPTTPR